jgi:tol-pal system protein YbgF
MSLQKTIRLGAVLLAFSGINALPVHAAVNKDMVQLQQQIQDLQTAIAKLQQSNDERMGVLKDLVQQTADSVNKMSIVVNGLQLRMQNVQDASAAKNDQLSGQIQSLNDSLDEMKARMGRMEKALNDIQSQQASTNAILNNLPGNSAAPIPGQPLPAPGPGTSTTVTPGSVLPARQSVALGPSAGDLYKTAYSDYMAGKYPLSASEFNNLITSYPDDTLAGNAYFYLGEIDMKGQKLTSAVKSYDLVLERYPDNAKIPSAHLHKGEALIAMKNTDAGTRELHTLIQRFPNSPEAAQARTRLATLAAHK